MAGLVLRVAWPRSHLRSMFFLEMCCCPIDCDACWHGANVYKRNFRRRERGNGVFSRKYFHNRERERETGKINSYRNVNKYSTQSCPKFRLHSLPALPALLTFRGPGHRVRLAYREIQICYKQKQLNWSNLPLQKCKLEVHGGERSLIMNNLLARILPRMTNLVTNCHLLGIAGSGLRSVEFGAPLCHHFVKDRYK